LNLLRASATLTVFIVATFCTTVVYKHPSVQRILMTKTR